MISCPVLDNVCIYCIIYILLIIIINATVTTVTESWLTDSVPSTAISIGQSFNVFRKGRPTPGGGVLAYVHSSIPTIRLGNIEASDKEVLWLLHTPPRISRPFRCIITANLYFLPGKTCTEERELIDHITERLDNLLIERPSAGIIITGDFNHLISASTVSKIQPTQISQNAYTWTEYSRSISFEYG